MKKYLLAICLVLFGCGGKVYPGELSDCLTCGDVLMGEMTSADQGCPETYPIWYNLADKVCHHSNPCFYVCNEPLCLSNGLDAACTSCLHDQKDDVKMQEALQLCFDQ